MLVWANVTLQHTATIHVPVSGWFITPNFCWIMIVFCWFFTWIGLGDVDLCLSLILVTKTNAVAGGTTSAAWLYHHCNQCMHVTDGMWWQKSMLLKGELHRPCDNINIITPNMWLMVWQWRQFLIVSNTRQVWPWIFYTKLH